MENASYDLQQIHTSVIAEQQVQIAVLRMEVARRDERIAELEADADMPPAPGLEAVPSNGHPAKGAIKTKGRG